MVEPANGKVEGRECGNSQVERTGSNVFARMKKGLIEGIAIAGFSFAVGSAVVSSNGCSPAAPPGITPCTPKEDPTEIPCNGVDEDCVDGDASGTDADGDGYFVEGGACGEVDCNDNDLNINPSTTEIACDTIDQNCDGIDGTGTDADGDGYTVEGSTCSPVDCNDSSPDINPGETDVACDAIDQDCSGTDVVGTDLDGDGYKTDGGEFCGPVDCDDNNALVNQGETEVACNDLDENCDGVKAQGTDADGDGYFIEGEACGPRDCDDANVAVHPGASEVVGNGVDEDCDGQDLLVVCETSTGSFYNTLQINHTAIVGGYTFTFRGLDVNGAVLMDIGCEDAALVSGVVCPVQTDTVVERPAPENKKITMTPDSASNYGTRVSITVEELPSG